MTASPIEMPGQPTHVVPLAQAPLPSPYAMQRDNSDAVQVLIDRTGLPAPTVVPQADRVHVMLADVDDLVPWFAELDGWVGVSRESGALRTWTLHTELAATHRRAAVRIEVHALVVDGQAVLPSLRDAAGVAA